MSSDQKVVTAVLLKCVDNLPRPGWFHVRYDFRWGPGQAREYRITIEAHDELDAVVEFRKWARANKYLIEEPDDGDDA